MTLVDAILTVSSLGLNCADGLAISDGSPRKKALNICDSYSEARPVRNSPTVTTCVVVSNIVQWYIGHSIAELLRSHPACNMLLHAETQRHSTRTTSQIEPWY